MRQVDVLFPRIDICLFARVSKRPTEADSRSALKEFAGSNPSPRTVYVSAPSLLSPLLPIYSVMTPSLLAISTSPRRHGNSESALDTILAEIGGHATTEKIVLSDLTVAPCKGCGACEKLGRCIQEDDFQPLAQKILAADILILASPVYSLSVCAQAKALIDRCQVFWSQKYVLHTFAEPAGKKIGLFIATAGQTSGTIFDHTVPVARFLFDVSGIKPKHTMLLLLNGLDKKTDFQQNPAAVTRAKETAAALLTAAEEL